MGILNVNNKKSHLERNMFFDEAVDVARYDKVKYNNFEKLTEKQMSFFWRPEEVDINKDNKDFKRLTPRQKHIFQSNLSRQIILDSVQGRAPTIAFLPITSLPEVENWIQTWAFFETIHSRSYTHIIRNIYSDPSKIFDEMMDIQEIVDCAKDISIYYDRLIEMNNDPEMYGSYAHKKALWLCLNAVNFLEGIRFYVSFACSWAFAELKTMEGNAKIIKFIARDENLHLASTQQMIKLLVREDSDYATLQNECKEEVFSMVNDIVNQEKKWADYLMGEESMIGLNYNILCDFVDERTDKCLKALGYPPQYGNKSNVLPWTQKWISGSDVQVAPQETEISSYTIGGIKNDLTEESFKGFKL